MICRLDTEFYRHTKCRTNFLSLYSVQVAFAKCSLNCDHCYSFAFDARTQCVRAAIAMATWLCGCVSVMLMYCAVVLKLLGQLSCDLHQIVAQPF